MKYARLELERRFLLSRVPPDLGPGALVTDHYLAGLRLRLRRIEHDDGAVERKLGQKFARDAPHRREMTTFYLEEHEYVALVARLAPGVRPLRKRRHRWSPDGRPWVVDLYSAPYEGLVVAEIEAPEAELLALAPPPWTAREITGEPSLEGGALAAGV